MDPEHEFEFEIEETDSDNEIGEEFDEDDEEEQAERGIRPYLFEPDLEAADAIDGDDQLPGVHNDEEDLEGRLGNNHW